MSKWLEGEHRIKWVEKAQMYCETWFEHSGKGLVQRQRWFDSETA